MVLELQAVVPVTGRSGEATNVKLFGTDFGSGITIKIDEEIATNVLVSSNSEITCTFPSDLEEGSHDVTVEIGAEKYTLLNAFIVSETVPEYPFSDQTFAVIQARMLGRMSNKYSKNEGSVIYDFLAPIALELGEFYLGMGSIVDLIYLLTSKGIYLDYKGIEYGVERRKATKAKGIVTLTGTGTITVPEGTIFSNNPANNLVSPIKYVTDEDVTLVSSGGSFTADVKVTAIERGKNTNLPAKAITQILDDVENLSSVNNKNATTGGSDREDDERYLSRILSAIKTPGRAGNVEDYKQWARQASEYVGKVGVDPLRLDETGSKKLNEVGVYFLQPDDTVPNAELIKIVSDYIGPDDLGKGQAPIGATPTISAPSFVDVSVKITFTASAGFVKTELTSFVQESIQNFINELDIGEDVRYHDLATHVNNLNGVQGVSDYAISSSNTNPSDTETSDIPINNTQKAQSATITVK